jgi:NADP-dependent 3-hydroxy acid dehydrogenase YdfG
MCALVCSSPAASPPSSAHNTGAVREQIDAFYAITEALAPDDIADGVAYMVTRPRHASIGELWIMPTDQA